MRIRYLLLPLRFCWRNPNGVHAVCILDHHGRGRRPKHTIVSLNTTETSRNIRNHISMLQTRYFETRTLPAVQNSSLPSATCEERENGSCRHSEIENSRRQHRERARIETKDDTIVILRNRPHEANSSAAKDGDDEKCAGQRLLY